jgi:NAD-dependent SIR2 family protein deacetylase
MEDERCVPCEATGKDEVLAVTTVHFNGQLIPCCEFCKDLIEKDLLFYNEEPDESEDY